MKRLSAPAAALLRGVASTLSPPGRGAALVVLMYHRVLEQADPMLPDEPDVGRFAAQMDVVKDLFRVVDLADGVAALKAGKLPARCAAITFDDGYANNLEVASPILRARGMTATFFIATGFLEGHAMWNDLVIESVRRAPARLDLRGDGLGLWEFPDWAARRAAVDRILGELKYLEPADRLARARGIVEKSGWEPSMRPMMQDRDLKALVQMGMAVGAHTVSHPILARLPDPDARREIVDSRGRLEEILRIPVRTFAYPNGRPRRDYDRRHVAMVKNAGFEAGLSTAWGAATAKCDPFQVPRVAPWDRAAWKFNLRLLRTQLQRRPDLA